MEGQGFKGGFSSHTDKGARRRTPGFHDHLADKTPAAPRMCFQTSLKLAGNEGQITFPYRREAGLT